MYSAVKTLRVRGLRRHEREIMSSTAVEGDLTLSYCAGTPQLNLGARDDSTAKPLLPVLHDARLVTMHGNMMLFKGLEKDGQGAEWAQEWSVMVVAV